MVYSATLKNVQVEPNNKIDIEFCYVTETVVNESEFYRTAILARERAEAYFKEHDYSDCFTLESLWYNSISNEHKMCFKVP